MSRSVDRVRWAHRVDRGSCPRAARCPQPSGRPGGIQPYEWRGSSWSHHWGPPPQARSRAGSWRPAAGSPWCQLRHHELKDRRVRHVPGKHVRHEAELKRSCSTLPGASSVMWSAARVVRRDMEVQLSASRTGERRSHARPSQRQRQNVPQSAHRTLSADSAMLPRL
jgi:hypothetical protein